MESKASHAIRSHAVLLFLVHLCLSESLLRVGASRLGCERKSLSGWVRRKRGVERRSEACKRLWASHMSARKTLEEKKVKALRKAIKNDRDVEEVFLSDSSSRVPFYLAYKYAAQGAKENCQWGDSLMSEFEAWVADLLPKWHRCIEVTMKVDSLTKKRCWERFTQDFGQRLKANCKDVKFYDKVDLNSDLSAQGIVPKASDPAATPKPSAFHRPTTDRRFIVSETASWGGMTTSTAVAVTGLFVVFGSPALAVVGAIGVVGLFAMMIAFLVCKLLPREKLPVSPEARESWEDLEEMETLETKGLLGAEW